MAQPIACDICGEENAVQMLTNLETGETIAMGPACLPIFYGQSVLQVTGAGEHKGLPQKCQACRRIHEQMTLTTHQAGHAAATARDLPESPLAPAEFTGRPAAADAKTGTEDASVSGQGITVQPVSGSDQ